MDPSAVRWLFSGKENTPIETQVYLEILSYGKLKLVNEDLLECIEVVLLVENKHRLLVVNRINSAKTQWAIAVGN